MTTGDVQIPAAINAAAHRYLTKTRFAVALECPTKLRYLGDSRYANRKEDNDFLSALAEAGHQVGALAKTLLGPGVQVTERDHEAAIIRTEELLATDNALVFEAAVRWQNCFIRVDLLEKRGNTVRLYEVKAKSYDPEEGDGQIIGKKGGLLAGFKPYVYDVAFQRYVARKAFPNLRVGTSLVFINKRAISPEPVLQRLVLRRVGRHVEVDIDHSLRDGKAAHTCLIIVPADEFADQAERGPLELGGYTFSFAEGIEELMQRMNGEPFVPRPGSFCKGCEFRALPVELEQGMLDGRAECWSTSLGVAAHVMHSGSILDLYRFLATDRLVQEGKLQLADLEEADVKLKEDGTKISLSHRQWLQCGEQRGEIDAPWHRQGAIDAEFADIEYPLHFIDFETARPALPLHAVRRPYEQIIFQFSHHVVARDGTLSHAHEYLYAHKGGFPNYEVLRALLQAIGQEAGTVFHWWDHEKTVLNEIRRQLETDVIDIPDRAELISFIDSLVGVPNVAPRLFDLGRMIDRSIFIPGTKGSSSIKKVLPALLSLNAPVREKYAQPIYGATLGIRSHNFSNFTWIRYDNENRVVDPYDLLGKWFGDPDLAQVDELEKEEAIAEGGAAMVAYGLLESELISDADASELRRQLLRYCELDTLAMVMVLEVIQTLQ